MIAFVIHVSGLTNVMTACPYLESTARNVLKYVQLIH